MLRTLPAFALLFFVVLAATADTSPLAAANGFGGAVAVSDGSVFVGSAPAGWQTGNKPAGVVLEFRKQGDEWVEVAQLRASDGTVGDHFGRSIAAQGNRVVVGAPGAGAAYVFERSADSWTQVAKLTPSDLALAAEFGGAYARTSSGIRTGGIAIDGDMVAVTAYDKVAETGKVHVFASHDGMWHEDAILEADAEGSRFGWAVAVHDNHVAVSAPNSRGAAGSVHVFARSADGMWSDSTELTGADGGLGSSLVAHGDMFYASAPTAGEGGTVLAWHAHGDGWMEAERMEFEAPARGAGRAMAVTDDAVFASFGGGVAILSDGGQSVIQAPDARSERSFAAGLAAAGDVMVAGSPSAEYEAGVANVFQPGPSGEWQAAGLLLSEVEHLSSITGRDEIRCEEGKAEMFDCEGVDMVSFLSLGELASDRGVRMTDIWGWEDPETGKEWVLQARTEGVSFVDISNPANPVYVGQIYKTEGSPGAAWRDVKVYQNHAYIVADGSEQHGVQIFDLTQLRDVDPADMPVTFEETARYDGVASTHNIVINEETGFAYAVGNRSGGETCSGQMHIIDIREPANPQFAGCFAEEGVRGTHDAQCVVYRGPDEDHRGKEVCFNSTGRTFIIADVTDKANTKTIANRDYPLQAYTHQGWLTEDHNYFYMNDELDEMNGLVEQTRTLIWDVQDLDDPQLVSQFLLDSAASDHNLYVKGNLMYQSNYQAGLRILDITDPVAPVEVGHFDTAPYAEDAAGFGGSWSNYPYFKSGVIAVSSRNEGLFILRKQERDL